MKELQFLINDVREQTDNDDTNGVKDREIIRYFNDGIKTIQTIIFKNNPLCTYYQQPIIYQPLNSLRVYDIPSDCYGDNAVSLVEIQSSLNGLGYNYYPVDRVWPEDGQTFFGWFIKNKQIFITGDQTRSLDRPIRAWYFKRLPRFDKAWGTANGVAGQVLTIINNDVEMFKIDRYISIIKPDGTVRLSGLPFVRTTDTTLTIVGDITTIQNGDYVVMGKNTLMSVDLPEEVESYLMDYVAQRVFGRNNYGEDWNKQNFWTSEERSNIISIFADASQAEVRAPITDTEYMRI